MAPISLFRGDSAKVIPAAPPKGQTSNIVNPSSLSEATVIVSTVCVGVTLVAVLMRVLARCFVRGKLGADDYSALVAGIGLIPYMVIVLLASHDGQGLHSWDISVNAESQTKVLFYVLLTLYQPIALAAKISILIHIRKVFVFLTNGLLNRCIDYMIMFNVIFYVGTVMASVILFFQRGGEASIQFIGINVPAFLISTSIVNVISGACIFALPMIYMRHLHMSSAKGLLAYIFVTCSGLFTITVCIRRAFLGAYATTGTDKAYSRQEQVLVSLVEMSLLICGGCLPVAPQFIRFCLGQRQHLSIGYPMVPQPSRRRSAPRPGGLGPWAGYPIELAELQPIPATTAETAERRRHPNLPQRPVNSQDLLYVAAANAIAVMAPREERIEPQSFDALGIENFANSPPASIYDQVLDPTAVIREDDQSTFQQPVTSPMGRFVSPVFVTGEFSSHSGAMDAVSRNQAPRDDSQTESRGSYILPPPPQFPRRGSQLRSPAPIHQFPSNGRGDRSPGSLVVDSGTPSRSRRSISTKYDILPEGNWARPERE